MDYAKPNEKHKYFSENKHLLPEELIRNYEAAFNVEYAHNSTAIEGNTLSLAETKLLLEDKLSVGGKELREIYEITNHAKAFDYVKLRVSEGKALDENIVKDIHERLTENIFPGGVYRNVNVRITGAAFEPPSPEAMYVQIKNFYEDLRFKAASEAVETAAWTHAEFVRIHPFIDGNGRTARLLMNHTLMLRGLPPVSVAKKNKQAYYDALEKYAAGGDIRPFAEFTAELVGRELDKYIAAIRQIKAEKQSPGKETSENGNARKAKDRDAR